MTALAPWLFQITLIRDVKLNAPVPPVIDPDVAKEAASIISPYPERTEPAKHMPPGYWFVWLPAHFNRFAWDGSYIEIRMGGFRLLADDETATVNPPA